MPTEDYDIVWHGGLMQTDRDRYTCAVKGELLPAYHSTAHREEISALHDDARSLAHKRAWARSEAGRASQHRSRAKLKLLRATAA